MTPVYMVTDEQVTFVQVCDEANYYCILMGYSG